MASEQPSNAKSSSPPVVSYTPDALADAANQLSARYEAGKGVCIVFVGGTRGEHQHALAALAEHTAENVHQFTLPALVKERRMQTQSSIRKAFDAAAEEGAFLFFEEVDMLFGWRHPDTLGGEEEPSSVEYFLQRVEAYDGIVALALEAPDRVEAVRPYGVHLIVDFR